MQMNQMILALENKLEYKVKGTFIYKVIIMGILLD